MTNFFFPNEDEHESEEHLCPSCHQECDVSVFSVVVTIANWPQSLLIGLFFVAFGQALGLTQAVAIAFSVAAIVPLCLSGNRKRLCSDCGVELDVSAEKSKSVAKTSDQ